MGRRRKRHYDLDLVSDINVTSLVDVTMTLLIIFIIVAPMIEQGIDITLPTAEPKRIDVASVMTVSVAGNERVYLEGQRVTMDELRERLANVHAASEDIAVLVKADTDLRYGKVVEVLDAIRSVGITRLAMATKPS
ncbi:MAG: biopolymer transporter ExbD [Candidatus Eisenbacteria bacterium]|nr:biopolymer transporter ExbD [Candidatus Eisenbacteria bacterium]